MTNDELAIIVALLISVAILALTLWLVIIWYNQKMIENFIPDRVFTWKHFWVWFAGVIFFAALNVLNIWWLYG